MFIAAIDKMTIIAMKSDLVYMQHVIVITETKFTNCTNLPRLALLYMVLPPGEFNGVIL